MQKWEMYLKNWVSLQLICEMNLKMLTDPIFLNIQPFVLVLFLPQNVGLFSSQIIILSHLPWNVIVWFVLWSDTDTDLLLGGKLGLNMHEYLTTTYYTCKNIELNLFFKNRSRLSRSTTKTVMCQWFVNALN